MKRILSFFAAAAVIFMAAAGCSDYVTPPNTGKPDEETPGNETEEKPVDEVKIWNIGTHRGGYLESGHPDCSIAGLEYSIALKCKYSECDIVLTKDNDILIVHPSRQGDFDVVNGLVPSEHTVADIRKAGKLKNGEEIPTLREFITFLQNKEKNTIGHVVWMDVKEMMVNGQIQYQLSIDACIRAAEIVKEMNAQNVMEFIIPSGQGIYPHVRERVINEFKMNIGWMSATSPANYQGGWAQLRYDKVIGENRTIDPQVLFNANVPLSIYYTENKDKSDEICDLVVPYYPHVKCRFTNSPLQLIYKLKKAVY